MSQIKTVFILTGLLLLCSACVSRTVTSPGSLSGKEKEVIVSKKTIWFWQDDYSK